MKGNALIAILAFFLGPLVALIMWAIWKDSKPGWALSAMKGGYALVSLYPILGFILWLIQRGKNPAVAKVCLISQLIIVGLLVIASMGLI